MEEGRPAGRGDLELGRALVVADAVWSRPREGARAWYIKFATLTARGRARRHFITQPAGYRRWRLAVLRIIRIILYYILIRIKY